MEPALMAANPLVEETRNQVAVQRGPVVYCLESPDIPDGSRIFDYKIPSNINFTPIKDNFAGSNLVSLEGDFYKEPTAPWNNALYREIPEEDALVTKLKLVPYFAWDNRGKSEMTVWIPLKN